MQKTVLMITRPYYPSNASGAHRSAANAKYLPLFGWEPIIVCKRFSPKNLGDNYDPQLAVLSDNCEVIRVYAYENRLTRKIENGLWDVFGGGKMDYRNPYFLYQRMKLEAERIVKSGCIDAVWATFSPGLDLKIADYLSRKYSIPWVADFRDLPDQSYNNRNIRYVVRQEIQICASAHAIVATTDQMAQKLRWRHKVPVYTIFNGFDPEEFEDDASIEAFGNKFTINHFGILYDFRNPSPLFAAVDLLCRQSKIRLNDISINFYGASSKIVADFASKYNCKSQVRTVDRLPYPEMLKCQNASQVLLMVASPGQGGAIPAKLYDYLASKRPILCVPGDGAGSDSIIHQTRVGISLSEPDKIAVWLERAYNQWKQSGIVDFTGVDMEIQKYSRKIQAGQLAEILQVVVSEVLKCKA